ncbi:pleckstrin homology domain-containing family D member 1 [Selaginella moellendorffii]|uniref:pleckstrin homology domain-containing family D member 1 n=1 Tax=Selaginella moellendorffii TaxID=88036 RepID=UPI000D1CB942|nr:pleckstrin homology domain-containing family D member 1 isoform X2 [Selaginella moellendorffii]XP_024540083.1 pleckstrin homology domain-containing family D member 1 [Selaginella moellendorffii]|eukprot:XP_024518181.1 pleckstrin homology domain-containing family D member 1 isoform X2 [Selaginella moellendorffii]
MAMMENKSLLWAHPEKSGQLLKRGSDIKSWKKRQFALKDTFLFYFKILPTVEQSEPTGVIPLQGCKVEAIPAGVHGIKKYSFIINLPDKYILTKAVKRALYILSAHDEPDRQSWIDAIRCASVSKQIIRAKLEHSRLEVHDLELRWKVASALDAGKKMPFELQESVVMQALADELMEVYYSIELLNQRLEEATDRYRTACEQLSMLEQANAMHQEALMREGSMQMMHKIRSDESECNGILEYLVAARISLRTLQKQVDALSGLSEGGEGVPSYVDIEGLLRQTLARLGTLEYQTWGTENLPDEEQIASLYAAIEACHKQEKHLVNEAAIFLGYAPADVGSQVTLPPPAAGGENTSEDH